MSVDKLYNLLKFRGAWVAQSVERPTSAHVMISQSVSLSPASGSVLTARSLEPASDSVSSSFSLCPSPSWALSLFLSLSLSLSLSQKQKLFFFKKINTNIMLE